MITVGFFWNVAAIATTGTFCSTAESACSPSAIATSICPAASSCRPFTCGPPIRIVDVQVVFPVRPFGDRLVEAAVLGLREPVGGEHDAVGGLRAAPAAPAASAAAASRAARVVA